MQELYRPRSPAGEVGKKRQGAGCNECVLLIYSILTSVSFTQPVLFILLLSLKVSGQGEVGGLVTCCFLFLSCTPSLTLATLTSWQSWIVEEEGFVVAGDTLSVL